MQAEITKLKSEDHLEVAETLTNTLLDEYAKLNDYKDLIDDLKHLRGVIWKTRDDFASKHTPVSGRFNLDSFNASEQERQKVFHDILGKLDTDEKRERFMEVYARMGHMYEMAGLIARDNFFENLNGKNSPYAPGAYAEAQLNAGKSWEAVVDNLGKPTLEYVFTAHPTNTNSLESMQAQRSIALALRDIRTGKASSTEKLQRCMRDFVARPLTPQIGHEVTNIDVAGETGQMLYYLGNVYDDLTSAYRRFDEPLSKKEGYDPLRLKLNMKFDSWGSSGDKDGNRKVNAQTTLLSMVMHREAILSRYVKNLQNVQSPELFDWKLQIENALRELAPVKEKLEAARASQDAFITSPEFDQLSKQFAKSKIDVEGFVGALEKSYRASGDKDEKNKLLSLVRRVRTFGDTFGHIEYRETAEEFTKIAAYLIDGYKEMDEQTRVAKLTEIIKSGKAKELLQAKWKQIESGAYDYPGTLKPYDDDDVRPIAYHTIKRLELAKEHPEMVVNQVLAECENTSNFLEAKLLMEALKDDKGKKPVLGIVPLFEKPEVMNRVGKIMRGAYENEAYRAHLDEFLQAHPGEAEIRNDTHVVTQQIQFAHSDNSRRAGLASARANIDEAHDVTSAIGKELGITTRYFQGGSLTDPYRGGTRAMTATINQYGLHNFFKNTVQGGDLLNYFNYPHSMVRAVTRVISHCAKHFDNTVSGKRYSKTSYAVDFLARKSLQGIYDDYNIMFDKNMLGRVLGESGFGHKLETPAGQVGSRAQRKAGAANTNEVAFADASMPIDPNDIRTINFSELFQHEGITPTWIGVRELKHKLTNLSQDTINEFAKMRERGEPLSKDERELEKMLEAQEDGAISAKAVHKLYQLSPVFKDIIDRVAFGVAMTDLDAFESRHPVLSKEYKQADKKGSDTIMKMLRSDYLTASRLAVTALTGKESQWPDAPLEDQYRKLATNMREQVRASLTFGHTVTQKSNYMQFVQAFKRDWKEKHTSVSLKVSRICHNALDTVTHGRISMADDPSYAEAYLKGQQGRVA